jgi:hypothetical protein
MARRVSRKPLRSHAHDQEVIEELTAAQWNMRGRLIKVGEHAMVRLVNPEDETQGYSLFTIDQTIAELPNGWNRVLRQSVFCVAIKNGTDRQCRSFPVSASGASLLCLGHNIKYENGATVRTINGPISKPT